MWVESKKSSDQLISIWDNVWKNRELLGEIHKI